jgi:hypothetical protein
MRFNFLLKMCRVLANAKYISCEEIISLCRDDDTVLARGVSVLRHVHGDTVLAHGVSVLRHVHGDTVLAHGVSVVWQVHEDTVLAHGV